MLRSNRKKCRKKQKRVRQEALHLPRHSQSVVAIEIGLPAGQQEALTDLGHYLHFCGGMRGVRAHVRRTNRSKLGHGYNWSKGETYKCISRSIRSFSEYSFLLRVEHAGVLVHGPCLTCEIKGKTAQPHIFSIFVLCLGFDWRWKTCMAHGALLFLTWLEAPFA